jgi:hypothetical protein
MENTQILLVGVVTVLTGILTLIGVQVFLILKEIKRTIEKMNKMLDDAGIISESVARPIASLSSSITGVSGIAGLFGWLAKMKKRSKKQESEESINE